MQRALSGVSLGALGLFLLLLSVPVPFPDSIPLPPVSLFQNRLSCLANSRGAKELGESEGSCRCLENHCTPAAGSRLTAPQPSVPRHLQQPSMKEMALPPPHDSTGSVESSPLAATSPFLDYHHPQTWQPKPNGCC